MSIETDSNDGVTPQQVRAYLKRKHESLTTKRLELWAIAQQDSQNIIAMIIDKYQPQQIIQWGSVLNAKHFSEASDIDLAVKGLDSLPFMQLLADAEDMTQFPLDLIQWENIHPSFQKIILMKGKIVYEQR
ncbi:MAG: nucleotidyltransferase domain-containing protein [Snowella sp.]|nr:nucleotidyltransferase domain-containing protein [Snowella sp.]